MRGVSLRSMAFDSGYEAAADYALSGELLAEVQALQWHSTTDGKTRRASALDGASTANLSICPCPVE